MLFLNAVIGAGRLSFALLAVPVEISLAGHHLKSLEVGLGTLIATAGPLMILKQRRQTRWEWG